ncbi:hypothetical protein HNO88_002651 [Novosphingobium chloroacetimidivorans]|uniref:Uncharacterized protein n=1 Tax=Novosphingobium chloroacetimidivorans TaxID=1428314 RepID=A0A7W7KAM8_9SPHN|nr:hypothetical protein [Novosphingobium chloroacetimidivorans]
MAALSRVATRGILCPLNGPVQTNPCLETGPFPFRRHRASPET